MFCFLATIVKVITILVSFRPYCTVERTVGVKASLAVVFTCVDVIYIFWNCRINVMFPSTVLGMAAMNGGLGASMANGSGASSMDALTQAYSGMQQYTASALPSLYSQSLLQGAAGGSQKEGGSQATHQLPILFRSCVSTSLLSAHMVD